MTADAVLELARVLEKLGSTEVVFGTGPFRIGVPLTRFAYRHKHRNEMHWLRLYKREDGGKRDYLIGLFVYL